MNNNLKQTAYRHKIKYLLIDIFVQIKQYTITTLTIHTM